MNPKTIETKRKYTLNQLGERMDKMEGTLNQIGDTLTKLVDRIDRMDARLDYNNLKKLPNNYNIEG